MKSLSLLVLAVLALPCVGNADVITLKDGSTVEGEIKRSADGYIVKQVGGTVANVPSEKVASIEVKTAQGADAAMGRLQSLRRAADNMPDIKQILDRYHTFIDQNTGTPASDAAQQDTKMWQDRLDHGLVKAGDKWLTTDERDELRGKSTDIAIMLHDMVKQGRLKQATPILDSQLQIDPQNISLIYLQGVMQYMQEFLPLARKAFEAVIATAPDHAPSLNNLAVILWRQKAPVAALGFYDRALLAAPASQDILDNIAEALNALPKEQHESPVVKKIVRHFKEQDDLLQKRMGEKGFYRWGAAWVSEKELKKLQDDENAIKDQIKQMETDFTSVQQRIAALDTQISQITNEMNLIDAQTYAQTANGQFVRLPYPPLYFTLGQQLAGLKTERAQRADDLDRLKKSAKQAMAKMPTPKYSGIQKIIDVDGVPLPAGARLPAPAIPVPPAATQPAAPVGPPGGAPPVNPIPPAIPPGPAPIPPPTTRPA